MKKATLLLALCLVISGMSFAKQGDFGIGVMLGEPSGLSLKIWTGDRVAINGGVAWSFVDPASLHIHTDIIFHSYGLFNVERGELILYYGIGGRLRLESDTRVGLRLPVGLSYELDSAPIDFFLEIVPMLDLAPDTEGGIGGAIGVRYFF